MLPKKANVISNLISHGIQDVVFPITKQTYQSVDWGNIVKLFEGDEVPPHVKEALVDTFQRQNGDRKIPFHKNIIERYVEINYGEGLKKLDVSEGVKLQIAYLGVNLKIEDAILYTSVGPIFNRDYFYRLDFGRNTIHNPYVDMKEQKESYINSTVMEGRYLSFLNIWGWVFQHNAFGN